MKYFNKSMVFFVFMLLSYGVDTFAYTYRIANQTGRDLKVKLYWVWGELTNHAHLIEAGSTSKLKFGGWEAGLCLTKIMVWTKNSAGKWRGPTKVKNKHRNESFRAGIPITGVCNSASFVLAFDEVFDEIVVYRYWL